MCYIQEHGAQYLGTSLRENRYENKCYRHSLRTCEAVQEVV